MKVVPDVVKLYHQQYYNGHDSERWSRLMTDEYLSYLSFSPHWQLVGRSQK